MTIKLEDSLLSLKGIGEKRAKVFAKKGIETVEDLIMTPPKTYLDHRKPTPIGKCRIGERVLIEGVIVKHKESGYGRNTSLKLEVNDGSGIIGITFFKAKTYSHIFSIGRRMFFDGEVSEFRGMLQLSHPDFYFNGKDAGLGSFVPVYPINGGIKPLFRRNLIRHILEEANIEEFIPEYILEANRLMPYNSALEAIHFPINEEIWKAAHYRLIFQELFLLTLALGFIKKKVEKLQTRVIRNVSPVEFIDSLNFELTEDQLKVIEEIATDLGNEEPMNRLVQGDVGCGKTIVAEAAMYIVGKSGGQSAMLAPTEILARQHFHNINKDMEGMGLKVALLIGSTPTKERRVILQGLKNGDIHIIIGTHAIIQQDVEFKALELMVTDEQHRFGVKQRGALVEKNKTVNVLAMTATPIPRTLAVVVYGDLDISIIRTMPKGREPIDTVMLSKAEKNKAYDKALNEIQMGHQVYVVAPLIEENEELDLIAAEDLFHELSERFSKYKVALIHGKLKKETKESIMEEFSAGNIQILVSTTIIEVGIDVPNATMMIIEEAHRFGLAQLHQLRGRVGRGSSKSCCILVMDDGDSIASKRGKVMVESQDGFFIAEQDLKLRGPGDLFGLRQHGIPQFHVADIARHYQILEKVKPICNQIQEADPYLRKKVHRPLKQVIDKILNKGSRLNI